MANTGSALQVRIDPDPEVPGQRRRTGKGHVASYGQGHVCAASGCVTQLSRYNPGSVCYLHDMVVMSASRRTR